MKEHVGQIQLLIYIIKEDTRPKTRGFISPNMAPIILEINEEGKPKIEKMIKEVLGLLKDKEGKLIPILPEKQQKLRLFSKELEKNKKLMKKLINEKDGYLNHLSIDPRKFEINYALQIVDKGHIFEMNLINKIENYIENINELNVWKNLAVDWAICRGQRHQYNTDNFYNLLVDSELIIDDMIKEIDALMKFYFK